MTGAIRTDYCIAGGGIAGILLASRLAASGKKILILDQGPRFTEEDRARMLQQSRQDLNDFADYNDDTDPASVTQVSTADTGGEIVKYTNGRLFGVGGSALHWGGIAMRPTEEDLRVRSLYGYGRDWPISYAELEPWLQQAETEIGVSGNDDNPYAARRSGPFPMPAHPFSYFEREIFGPALKQLGIVGHSMPFAVNSESYRNRSGCQACRACIFCPSGARYSPDRVQVPILDKHPNVTILENTSLRTLEAGPKGDRIVAAHAVRVKDRTPLVVQADHFVLAMGGIETPRMLMLSADHRAHKDGLGNMGGQLGRGFSDHPTYYVHMNLGRHAGRSLGFPTMYSDHFRVHVDRREQPTLWISAEPLKEWVPNPGAAIQWATRENTLHLDELREGIGETVMFGCMTEMVGKGKLELDSSKTDTFGSPLAKVTLKLTDWDRRGFAKFAALAPGVGEAMGAKSVAEFVPEPEFWGPHPSGATAMAKGPDSGVCDKDLKVFGLDNLYLASNSVFPHMGPSPATLTIAALALRLAGHLEGRLVP